MRVETRKLSISEMYETGAVDSGHAFLMLRPAEDAPLNDGFIRNHYFGYYPGDGWVASKGKVEFKDEHDYTHASPAIPISKETYDKIAAHIMSVKRDPGLYSVLDRDPNDKVHQCSTFVIETLRAGGMDICPEFGNGRLIAPENLIELLKLKPEAGVSKSTAEGGTRYLDWEAVMNAIGPRRP